MLISEKKKYPKKLSKEIMGCLLITAVIALFFGGFLYLTANAIATTYLLENDILLTKGQLLTLQAWIRSISLLMAVLLFLALFLFLLGQKMAYLREIIQGVEALRTHRMDFTMPIEGNNELTELAESINFLSETERRLRQRETALRAKKEQLIRDLSHDIRTPMNGIIGMTAIAASHIDDKERVQDSLQKITQASKYLLSLINEVLDMSKIESGKVDLIEEEFKLSDLAERSGSLFLKNLRTRRKSAAMNSFLKITEWG